MKCSDEQHTRDGITRSSTKNSQILKKREKKHFLMVFLWKISDLCQ
ncbi:Uncharacterized protein BM_BM13070 [Brugia malayi]|uniref:Bm13070 n=1 Tax=Brugia malayi TaxID=6279 RepID=A0A0K0IWS4_BRUMA|nr:Uncharacterized protein BM_BM13070 [Brugia malayi]CDP94683.1 Bm13070 [Brugia malayi]VIO86860.1 Uncharacterized protein BM_BM13070 [Brugia malayi]